MIDLDTIKATITIPDAWRKLGIEGEPKPGTCVSSPFREDRHPSFSISACGRFWHDFATDEKGDVFAFVSMATGKDFKEALAWLNDDSGTHTLVNHSRPIQRKADAPTAKKAFVLPSIDKGTIEELKTVANLRRFDGFYGLQTAANLDNFGFTHYRGHRCWIIYDRDGQVAQVRRIDGEPFHGEAKAITLSGSNARWPVGASCIQDTTTTIYLCEGTGDFLTALSIHAWDESQWRAVCMLGANMRIDEQALGMFKAKNVVIYAQNDDAGLKAAQCWANQLRPFAATVSAKVPPMPGADLNDAFVDELESEICNEY